MKENFHLFYLQSTVLASKFFFCQHKSLLFLVNRKLINNHSRLKMYYLLSTMGLNILNQRRSACRKSIQLFLLLRIVAILTLLGTFQQTAGQAAKAMVSQRSLIFSLHYILNPTLRLCFTETL